MKKFIIAVCCIVVCVLLFDYLYYYQGVYIDFFPNKKPITFVCTKGEKIYLDEGNGFEEFEIKGVDIGSGMPGEWSTDFGITKSDYLRWLKQIKEMGANTVRIKKIGCGIALDDFGSGYTSFSDLCDYPIDVIKIDRHIVAKSVSHRGNAVLIGIIRMAHDLGISVLCEGIENEVENQKVTDAKCDYIQGFLYSRVLPLENALDFYTNRK